MSQVVDPLCDTEPVRIAPAHRDEARRIASELAKIARTGKLLPGSISKRMTICGTPGCTCRGDPPKRHGPYYQWTRKVAAKTVGRWLSAEQATDYQSWVENDRRARELIHRLEQLSIATLETDARTRTKSKPGDDP